MTDGHINVSIEKIAHKTITELVQRISDEHRVQVEAINVRWADISTNIKQEHLVLSLGMRTSSLNRP